MTTKKQITDMANYLINEMMNFQEIVKCLKPSEQSIPEIKGVDIYGKSLFLNGGLGGDSITYIDFNKKYDLERRIKEAIKDEREDIKRNLLLNKKRAGILLADVSGHQITDSAIAFMLRQSFLVGARYELDEHGEITTRLFENLNTTLYKSAYEYSNFNKFLTMIYGEISENGKFRFISAAHPSPIIFSKKYNKLAEISDGRFNTFPPMGMMPYKEDIDDKKSKTVIGYKSKYSINEINLLHKGDILMLYTDGLSEHQKNGLEYFPGRLEQTLKKIKDKNAKDICLYLNNDIIDFGVPEDDVSFVIIKKS